mmetsp:Transcript_9552/g.28278  ORF Transcript_9552/g.28278 Transcript_9552/m.28278 type:complete len:237 (-) Transcript_9552:1629-2339(-)
MMKGSPPAAAAGASSSPASRPTGCSSHARLLLFLVSKELPRSPAPVVLHRCCGDTAALVPVTAFAQVECASDSRGCCPPARSKAWSMRVATSSMPSSVLSTHTDKPDSAKATRSGHPTTSPVIPTITPLKPISRKRRVASEPLHRGIWLSMTMRSNCGCPRASRPATRSMAFCPSSATSHTRPCLEKRRTPSVICSIASSSTWRQCTTPPLACAGEASPTSCTRADAASGPTASIA